MLESELFAFLESTADAAFSITETGEILSWNAAAEALFGFKASDVLQKHCYEVLDARGRQAKSPAEVSRAVGISPSTLRNHLHRINEKLGTRDRLSAVLNAMHRGLI